MNQKKSVGSFSIADYEKTHVFQLSKPATDNSLSTKEGQPILFPPSVTISAVDRILYTDQDGYMEERTIAYRPGYTSVFVSEGEDFQSLNENRSKSLGDIEFVHGFLRVSNRQPQLLDFLRLCNKNGTNKNRDTNTTVTFFEVDHEQAIQSILDNEERDLDIIHFCTKGSWEEVKSMARAMGVNVNNTPVQVRFDLRTFAMRNEDTKATFLRALKSPSVKRKATILEAIDYEIVKASQYNNTLAWVASGSVITTAPVGKDPIDYFVDNSFNNTQGETTFADIEYQLERLKNPVVATKTIQVDDDAADMYAFEDDPYNTLVRLGLQSGLLDNKGGYVGYKGKNYRKKEFMNLLESDKDLFDYFKDNLLPKTKTV